MSPRDDQSAQPSSILIGRRAFISALSLSPLAFVASCGENGLTDPYAGEPARLDLIPRKPVRVPQIGTDVILGEGLRRAYIRVPPGYTHDSPAPLVLLFHGAGGRAPRMLEVFGPFTDSIGAVALAPESLGITWDAFEDGFGFDISFINSMLQRTYDRCVIDPRKFAILGFSDGASYAMTLGLSNGDRLRGVIAFSGGQFLIDHPHGHPPFFVAHGTEDPEISVERSREIVPKLEALGSAVTYVEFPGIHVVHLATTTQAFAWLGDRFPH